jgi:RNA polymerase sigma-70 factor (ECF subfamily)
MADLSDDRLAEITRQNNRQAFEALMRRHSRRIFRVARGVLRQEPAAEDAVQETYLRAFAKLGTYEPAGKFTTWLTRIALNEASTIRRRTRGDAVSPDEVSEGPSNVDESAVDAAPTADPFVESAHGREMLEQAIDALPENFRMVFVLRVIEGLDVRDTSESLEINPTTVRTRLFRAHKQLRGDVSGRLRAESSDIFDFAAERCDRLVERVLSRLPA